MMTGQASILKSAGRRGYRRDEQSILLWKDELTPDSQKSEVKNSQVNRFNRALLIR